MDTTPEPTKRPYEAPRLDVEGTVTELTLAVDVAGPFDGAEFIVNPNHHS